MTEATEEMIAITGCGWITHAAAGSIREILARDVGTPAKSASNAGYLRVPHEVLDELPPVSKECRGDGAARLAASAFELARSDAGLSADAVAPERLGLVLGCSLSGQAGMIDFAEDVREQSTRFVSPIRFPQTVGNYVSGALARAFEIGGSVETIACGTASGTEAILTGLSILARREADVVLVGASERISDALARGLKESQESCDTPQLSSLVPQPHTSQGTRTAAIAATPQTPLSEGACMFVLERWADASKRGARALAFVTTPPTSAPTRDDMAIGDPIVSTAGFAQSGAILIEHMTGRCLGASGAAAVAAAIGAAGGNPVPWIDEKNQVTTGSVSAAAILRFDEAGQVRASAVAINDDGERSVVSLLVPR